MNIFPSGIWRFINFCPMTFLKLCFYILFWFLLPVFFLPAKTQQKLTKHPPAAATSHPCKRALHRTAYILLRTSPTSVLRCFRNRHQPGWLSDQRLGRKLRHLGFRKRFFLMSSLVKSGLFYFKHLLLLPVSGVEMRQNYCRVFVDLLQNCSVVVMTIT